MKRFMMILLCAALCLCAAVSMAAPRVQVSFGIKDNAVVENDPDLFGVMLSINISTNEDVDYSIAVENLTQGTVVHTIEGTYSKSNNYLMPVIPSNVLNGKDQFKMTIDIGGQTKSVTFTVTNISNDNPNLTMKIDFPEDGSVLSHEAATYAFDLTGLIPKVDANLSILALPSGKEIYNKKIEGRILSDTIGGARVVINIPSMRFGEGLQYQAILSQNGASVSSQFAIDGTPKITEIVGPKGLKPGATAQYDVSENVLPVTWRVEGSGISIDDTGMLIADESAEIGSHFQVYALIDGEEDELTKEGIIYGAGGLFESAEFTATQTIEGFTAGIPNGSNDLGYWETQWPDGFDQPVAYLVSDNTPLCTVSYSCTQLDSFFENPEEAIRILPLDAAPANTENWSSSHIEIDGHPAMVALYDQTDHSVGITYSNGIVDYPRNNHLYRVQFSAKPEYYTVTQNDMLELASYIVYDASKASVREDQVSLTVTSENNVTSVSAGKKLKFTATFDDPSFVNAKAKNNQVTWHANDNTAQPSADATIDAKGVLTVNKNLDEVKTIGVFAVSDTYGTLDLMQITLLPQVTAVNIEPAAVSLFAVDGAEETVTVSLEPSSVPLDNLTWIPSPKNAIEIEDHGDGTATIRPLKAGKATVTVKESGGKSGKFTVTVLQPVEALELSVKGKAVPGKSITINAKLTPNNATDKTLTWTLDVGEDIATISPKGQVKISKDAPVGTVITVTCTAEGAPEPVVATLELEVVEK